MSEAVAKPVCGVVMPISSIDGCAESHWADVLEIISESVEDAGFVANLVSNADDVGIIHKRIIQNLYDNPVVVCDVSGKNPNVMFELGMRLAFDKPTVIIKDEKTSYSFDTSAIEHLEYPRDLRFSRINEFKQKLTEKIKATHKRATTDPAYTTFLKHFGEFTVAKLDKKEVTGQQFIIDELQSMRKAMRRMEVNSVMNAETKFSQTHNQLSSSSDIDICMGGWPDDRVDSAVKRAQNHSELDGVRITEIRPGHKHLLAEARAASNISEIDRTLRGLRVRRNLFVHNENLASGG